MPGDEAGAQGAGLAALQLALVLEAGASLLLWLWAVCGLEGDGARAGRDCQHWALQQRKSFHAVRRVQYGCSAQVKEHRSMLGICLRLHRRLR